LKKHRVKTIAAENFTQIGQDRLVHLARLSIESEIARKIRF
jgi:hypothetical protein